MGAGIAGAIHELFVATATFQGGGPHTTAHGLGSLRAGIAGVIGGGNGGVGSTGPGDSIINNNNLGFSPGFGGWQR